MTAFTVTAVVYVVLIVAFFGVAAIAAIMMGREGIAQAQAEEWKAKAKIAESLRRISPDEMKA